MSILEIPKTLDKYGIIAEDMQIDSSMAATILSEYNYTFQRPIRPAWVAYLANEMNKGTFLPGTSIRLCVLGNTLTLVDGQHKLSAIIKSGIPQRIAVIFQRVANANEIADAYSREDSHLTRSISDSLRAHNLVEKLGLTQTQLEKGGSAVAFLSSNAGLKGGSLIRYSRDSLIEMIEYFANDLRAYFHATSGGNEKVKALKLVFDRRSTVAVGILSFHYSPDIANDFWTPMVYGIDMKAGDPRYAIREWQLANIISGGGAKSASKSPMYHFRAIVAAWNAFYKNRELRLIKVLDPSGPINMLGTPFSGSEARQPKTEWFSSWT